MKNSIFRKEYLQTLTLWTNVLCTIITRIIFLLEKNCHQLSQAFSSKKWYLRLSVISWTNVLWTTSSSRVRIIFCWTRITVSCLSPSLVKKWYIRLFVTSWMNVLCTSIICIIVLLEKNQRQLSQSCSNKKTIHRATCQHLFIWIFIQTRLYSFKTLAFI